MNQSSDEPRKPFVTADGVELEYNTTPRTMVYYTEMLSSEQPELKSAELRTKCGLSMLQGHISYYSTPKAAVEAAKKKEKARHRLRMEKLNELL